MTEIIPAIRCGVQLRDGANRNGAKFLTARNPERREIPNGADSRDRTCQGRKSARAVFVVWDFAPVGIGAVWDWRRLGLAPFGIGAVWNRRG